MEKNRVSLSLRISLIYIFLGTFWIFISDRLVAETVSDENQFTLMEVYKDWVFVFVTGLLLYLLLRREMRRKEKTETALRNSEEKFRSLFNNANGSIYLIELDKTPGCFIEVNDVACRELGYGREELLKMTIMDIIDKEELEKLPDIKRKCFAQGHATFEITHVAKDGSKIPVEVSSHLFTLNGKRVVLSGARDITQRKRAEEEISLQKAYFQKLFENSPDGIVMLDNSERVIQVNKGFEKLFQHSIEEVIGCHINELVVPESLTDEASAIATTVLDGRVIQKESVRKRKDGSLVLVSILGYPIIFNNRKMGIYVIYSDISERKKTEEALRISEEKFSKAFRISPDAININRLEDGMYLEINEGFTSLTGYTEADVSGKSSLDLNIWADPKDRARMVQQLKEKDEVQGLEAFFRRKDGGTIFALMSARLIEINGESCVLSITRDITERKRNEERLKYLSLHDLLTGLYNRVYFEQEVLRLEAERSYPVGIIVCDMDGLKLVNDTLGHDSGDNLLVAAAGVIKKSFRESDMVARVGGDEFAVLLPDTDIDDVSRACNRIRDAIKEYNALNPEIPLNISVGFAVSSDVSKRLVDIFKEADNNMYREKLHHSQSARSAIVQTLMKTLEARDYITEGHADRLYNLVADLAIANGLSEHRFNDLRLLAQFHDIGKVGIPDRILFKPGSLTNEEFSEMQRHCEIGYRIAQSATDLVPIADWVLKHHEWWNGNGYPLGLKGEEIPLECRILAIADAYDAMTCDRPYRKAMSHEDALAELWKCAGIQFDEQLVKKFIKTFGQKWIGYTIAQ